MSASWVTPNQMIPPEMENATSRTNKTDGIRPSLSFSNHVTGGVRTKLNNNAKANGSEDLLAVVERGDDNGHRDEGSDKGHLDRASWANGDRLHSWADGAECLTRL